jgi:predicted ATPase/DNA-binding SARP family transcriptional activator
MSVRLRLLGPPRLEVDGTITDLPVDRPASLAYYLVGRGDWVRRTELAYLYNPEADEGLAFSNLRKLIYRLKQHDWAKSLEVDQTRLRLLLESDVQEFHMALEQKDFAQALALYAGSFLEGVSFPDLTGYETWLELQRQDLARAWRYAVLEQARKLEIQHEFGDAERLLMRLLHSDLLDEDVVQALLRTLITAGERIRALEVFGRFRDDLKRELDAEPLETTRALIEQVRQVDPGNLKAIKHNLPAPGTRFVGRKRELQTLNQNISNPNCRLLTLVGLGGMGKSRLALECAAQQVDMFADGVWFVALAEIDSPDLLISSIAAAIGFNFYGPNDPKAQLINGLREKELLLILDNFEHLTQASLLLEELLEQASKLKLLVTSRVVLELTSEWVFDLEGLSYPALTGAESLEGFDAVQLFISRAERLASTFIVHTPVLEAIAELCHQVQGMPLALEIAATWTRSIGVLELVNTLRPGFDLSGSLESVPQRQRNLQVILDFTWRLLSDQEQAILCKLSVFRGGFNLEAAQAIAGAHLGFLLRFINHALLRRSQAGRFDMHELVRQFTAEKRHRHGDDENNFRIYLHYYQTVAQEAEGKLNGIEQIQWKLRIKTDYQNFLVALVWGIEHWPESTVILIAYLGRYWEATGLLLEGEKWLTKAISLRIETSIIVQTKLHLKLLSIKIEKGDYKNAENLIPTVYAFCQKTEDTGLNAEFHNLVGLVATQQRQFQRAQESLERGLTLVENHHDLRIKNYLLLNLGHLETLRNDQEKAFQYQQICLQLSRERQDARLEMTTLSNMAAGFLSKGEYEQSIRLSEEAFVLASLVDDQHMLIIIQGNLGYAKWKQGDRVAGELIYREHLLRLFEQGNIPFFVENAFELAHFWNHLGFPNEALCLWGAAEHLRTLNGYPLFNGYEQIQVQIQGAVPVKQQEEFLLAGKSKSSQELIQFIRFAARA